MKKRISLLFCMLTAVVCILSIGTAAATYTPDNDGLYTVTLDFENEGIYSLFVVKGVYDQTNYIEAYRAAQNSDILYFEQKTSESNGSITFGPFAPAGYFPATLIVGGTSLGEPYLAGYLSADGALNSASIVLSGIEQSYTVSGKYGDDINIAIEAQVLDSFGYPSVVEEKVTFELINSKDGVTINENIVTISKTAKAQAFTVKASAGDTSKTVYVEVKRAESTYNEIKLFADEACTQPFEDSLEVVGVLNDYPEVSVYAKTYDQFDEEISDTYSYNYAGKSVKFVFKPVFGSFFLTVYSDNSPVSASLKVVAKQRPDYKESALELFELFDSCRQLLAQDKNVSEDGKDVYPEETWTKQSSVDTFAAAIEVANTSLGLYGKDGYGDGDYVDEVTALSTARTTYENSFKAGTRKDLISVAINESDAAITTGQSLELTTTTDPRIGTTTDILTWTSSDVGVATVTAGTGGKATVKGIASGKATITVTTRAGLTDSIEVTVIKKTLSLTLTSNVSATTPVATYGGDPVILKAKDGTKGSTDVITWTVANPEILDLKYNEYIDDDGFRVIEATVIPKSAGTTKVTVSAQYGEKSQYKNVKVVLPDWETASAPVANIGSGSLLAGTEVSLSCATENAKIYYTLDGSEPTVENGRRYTTPIAISKDLTLKAVAVGDSVFNSEVVTYEYNVVASAVRASSGVARRGDDVDVTISVEDFEDIKEAVINIAFDNTVLDWKDTEFLCGHIDELKSSFGEPEAKVVLNYKGDGTQEAFSYDGDVIKLTFRVREEAIEGTYPVSVSASIVRSDDSAYDAASVDGKVVVNNYIIGDANDDGKIGLADVLLIKQYIAGNEAAKSRIVAGASDVDADGDIDNDDVTLLSKYCVGWNVTLG